jgi:hypothetical protein
MKHFVLFIASAWLTTMLSLVQAQNLPTEVAQELPKSQFAGATKMKFLGLGIYDAKLWTAPGFKAERYADAAFVLELSYLRSLSGSAIASRSLDEMRRAGAIDAANEKRWLAAMQDAFPDVKATDRIVGVHTPGVGARFWFNGKLKATIADPEFSRLFFGIWLSNSTSEPRLRTELLARIEK